MHTFSKEKDGTYAIGHWTTTALEYRFTVLFYVADLASAFAAVTTLNGSDPTHFDVMKEPKPSRRITLPWWAGVLIGLFIGFAFRIGH